MSTAEQAVKKEQPVIMPDRVGLAEHKRHDWVVDVPLGVTVEQATEPAFWAHVAAQMDPLDHIELRAEDGSWVAYMIVAYCERNYAKVVLDRVVKLEANHEIPMASRKHSVEWKGPHLKWSVIRMSDREVLKSGMSSKGEAANWMTEHEKTIGR